MVVSGNTHDVLVENIYCECSAGAATVMPWYSKTGAGKNNITNITFRGIVANQTAHGAGVKSEAQYQGTVSGVLFDDVKLIDVHWFALYVNPFNQSSYQRRGDAHAGTSVSHVSDVTWTNVTGTLTGDCAPGHFWCDPDEPCTGLHMEDVQLSSSSCARKPYTCSNAFGSAKGVLNPPVCFA